jgi:hypothetical protein
LAAKIVKEPITIKVMSETVTSSTAKVKTSRKKERNIFSAG